MRHRGVGEHPLHVGLDDREDRSDQHRQDRDDPQHRLPVPAFRAEGDVEEPQQCAERRDLGAGRHERRHGGRGALVDVGRPRLERRGADLEQQADREHAHADQQQRGVRGVVADRLVDVGELHGAGEAVGQRDAVEEEAGGERAEQEVLECGLLAQQSAPARQAAEQVERQREHLERHEHREQVVGRREEHHAADREHQQRVDLGVVEAPGRRLALGLGAGQRCGLAGERRDPGLEPALGEEQHAADREDQHQAPEEDRGTVDRQSALGGDLASGHHVAGGLELLEVGVDVDGAGEGDHKTGEGETGLGQVAPLAGDERLHDDTEAGDAEDDEHRPQLGVLDGGLREVHQ